MSLQFNDHNLKVSGKLGLQSIRTTYEAGAKIIRHREVHQIDFADAEVVDTSALALLTSWLRVAKRANKTIVFKNLPNHLIEVAKLSNIEKIITTGNNNG